MVCSPVEQHFWRLIRRETRLRPSAWTSGPLIGDRRKYLGGRNPHFKEFSDPRIVHPMNGG
jgi:hypothetical protein